MEMQGKRALAVTQAQAWEALNDPQVLKLCIPGCDRIDSTGPDAYAIGMGLKIGPVSAKFSGNIQLADIQAPESYTLSFDGQGGAAGFGKGTSRVSLLPLSQGGCELNYTVHATVGGKIAQLGQRLIDAAAKSIAEDFFKRFDAQMTLKYPAPVPSAVLASDEVSLDGAILNPTSSDKNSGLPIWIWGLIAGAAALAVFWLSR
jgi:uncharacterized protein